MSLAEKFSLVVVADIRLISQSRLFVSTLRPHTRSLNRERENV